MEPNFPATTGKKLKVESDFAQNRNSQLNLQKLSHIEPDFWLPRLRLSVRWFRFGLKFLLRGDLDWVVNAAIAEIQLMKLFLSDMVNSAKNVECNVCGWQGRKFYPNVGPGYFEQNTICPQCLCQDRHRSLIAILHRNTDLFESEAEVIEVAPMRSFQQYCLQSKDNKNYISFDIARFAMERGDITQLRFPDASTDYFLCFHVLEHIKEDDKALDEIYRVLRPGGYAVLQVPVDWKTDKTVEYSVSNPLEANHVRRYGKDFSEKIAAHDFDVTSVSVTDCFSQYQIEHYGFSKEPIFFAKKTVKVGI